MYLSNNSEGAMPQHLILICSTNANILWLHGPRCQRISSQVPDCPDYKYLVGVEQHVILRQCSAVSLSMSPFGGLYSYQIHNIV